MKKIILLLTVLIASSIVSADSDSTFHTARTGGNDTYFNLWAGDNNFGNFFDRGFFTTQEKILETIEWFNTELFRNNTTGGALSHLLLLSTVISLVAIAEVSVNPALMLLAGLSMFFFGWLVLLSVSMIVGFFIFPFSTVYIVRIASVMKQN